MPAFATSPGQLILARALLGIAGATLAPSTLSLIFTMFQDPGQRARAIAIWISAFSAGSAIGPVVGGLLLEHFWWGSVFLIALPVMAALLVLGPFLLPEYRDPDAGRLDLPSAGLLVVAVLAVIFGLKQTAQDGLGVVPVAAVLGGLVAGTLFARRQLQIADPVLDLRLFRIPEFSASLLVNFLTVFVAVGYFLFVAQYLQLVVGLPPFQAGLWSVPSALGFIAGSNAAPRLLRYVRPARLIGGAMLLASAGLVLLAQAGGSEGLAIVVVGSVIISTALAPVFGLTTEMIVGSAPPERAGTASGMSETSAELGGALGIAILGSIGVALDRGSMARDLPASIPPEAALAARDTLGGAVAVAAQLPADLGAALLAVARHAYVIGMQVGAVAGTALAVVVAGLALTLLRDVGANQGTVDDGDGDGEGEADASDRDQRRSRGGERAAAEHVTA